MFVNEYNEEVYEGYTVQMAIEEPPEPPLDPYYVKWINADYMKRYTAVDTEQPEQRPRCIWEPDRGKPQSQPCGSEQDLFKVKRHTITGGPREAEVCGKHLNDSWKKWTVEEAVKVPSRTTGLDGDDAAL